MKKLILINTLLFALALAFSLPADADYPNKNYYESQNKQMKQKYEIKNKDKETQREKINHSWEMAKDQRKYQKNTQRGNQKSGKSASRGNRGYQDYGRYSGYRKNPYGKKRHYNYYSHKGRRYNYRGHWRSWDQWDKYARRYPDMYRYGRYYQDGAHLMFRFCEPGSASCIFFSIGR